MLLVSVDSIRAAEALLNTISTSILPLVISEREQASLLTDLLHDALDSLLLLRVTGNGGAVGLTLLRPANLRDVFALSSGLRADSSSLLELLLGEVTGGGSLDLAGEVGVDLHGEDVDGRAESSTLLLPDVDRLGGGDGDVLGETGALELLTDIDDVLGECLSGAVSVEERLVTDNDHGDAVLVGALDDLLELVVCVGGEGALAALAAGLKEDAIDDLQAVLLALWNDVLEDTAISAVAADGGEAEIGDLLDVALNFRGGLALALSGVGRVGDGPLVAIGYDVASGGVGTLGLGLSRLAGLGRHGVGLRGWLGCL